MASRFLCTCGERVGTNMFCGETVYRLVSDDAFDALPKPMDSESVNKRFFDAPAVYHCRACGRLYVDWRRDQTTVYALEQIVSDEGAAGR